MEPELAVTVPHSSIGRYVKILTTDELAGIINWIEARLGPRAPKLSTANLHMYETVLNRARAELASRQMRIPGA